LASNPKFVITIDGDATRDGTRITIQEKKAYNEKQKCKSLNPTFSQLPIIPPASRYSPAIPPYQPSSLCLQNQLPPTDIKIKEKEMSALNKRAAFSSTLPEYDPAVLDLACPND